MIPSQIVNRNHNSATQESWRYSHSLLQAPNQHGKVLSVLTCD